MRPSLHLNRTFRAAGLLLLGALAVHWLRYWLAYGSQAASELHRQGHSYLADLVPFAVALSVALGLGAVALRLAAGDSREGHRSSRARAGVVYAIALFAVFAAQELSEGALAGGHPQGVAGVFASGGWLALPMSALVGMALAWVSTWLERAEQHVVDLVVRSERRRYFAPPLWVRTRPGVARIATLLLAFGFSRRPPPALS